MTMAGSAIIRLALVDVRVIVIALAVLALAGFLYARRQHLWSNVASRFLDQEWYWRVRRRVRFSVFQIARLRYRARSGRQRYFETVRASTWFARRALVAAALATGIAVLLYLAEDSLVAFIRGSSWIQIHLDWLYAIATRDELVRSGLYHAVLGTAIGVLGVFIALFAGALATSGEALSGRVSLTARGLLLRDPQVAFIARLFSFTVMLSFVLLIAEGAGARTSLVGMLVTASLTALAVFVAALLVRSGFYFLDPIRLIRVPLRSMLRSARLATRGGFRFTDPNFQDSYRKWAASSFDEVSVLWQSELLARPIQDSNVAKVSTTALGFVTLYERLKRQIPSASHWHAREPRHEEWYLAPYSRVELAAATDTPLQPDLQPNRFGLRTPFLD
jgi:hypothetical protein